MTPKMMRYMMESLDWASELLDENLTVPTGALAELKDDMFERMKRQGPVKLGADYETIKQVLADHDAELLSAHRAHMDATPVIHFEFNLEGVKYEGIWNREYKFLALQTGKQLKRFLD